MDIHTFSTSCLSPLEFLQYVAGDFGLAASGKNKSDLLVLLGRYLIDRHKKRLTTVLVVDEAHHLSAEVLEEIRLLTNLETTHAKLLQILLVGQSELDEKLDSFELRQLKQRIALRSRLGRWIWGKPLATSSVDCTSPVQIPVPVPYSHPTQLPKYIAIQAGSRV